MKNKFTPRSFFVLAMVVASMNGFAQCPAGSAAAQLNWDNIDFLPSNNMRYTSFYPNAAFPYTQNFTIGTRTLNFAMGPAASLALSGENGTNTAAAGDDVQFTTNNNGNNTITMTFDIDVANVKFSLFDVDANQKVTVTAANAASAAQTIAIVKPNATSAITIAGSGTATATATGPAVSYADNDTRGSINVTIAGPVKKVIVTLNTFQGDVWMSDIDACVTGSFPLGYQKVSRPFTNQPQYVLTVVNNTIYYTDPANGNCYYLFTEPGHNRLNSMAYDPYERIVYYTYSLGPNPQTDKTLKKYDVDSKTISVVIPDVNTFGIPTYESGVESGAATFYNGSLYLGIEGYTGTTGGGAYAASRKSTVWKIDFDGAGNPIAPAAQVFGVLADDGSDAQNIHDWSDFGISDGILIDFDGSQSGDIDYYHFNLMTGAVVNDIPAAGSPIPRQVSIGWDELLYNVDATIARYNNTNNVVAGTTFTLSAPLGPAVPVGSTNVASWGDAAGPYRPFLDFGDAPATYDPDPLAPACHDTLTPTVAGKRTKLLLGPAEDLEWLKRGFTTVEDNFEDGLAFVPLFSSLSGTYLAQVTTFNNTGQNATLCAWLDYNANGVFDAGEAITPITVPSAAGTQTFALNWSGIATPLLFGSTYLRIRITSSSFGMGAANATGYYSRGEVEDYQVFVENFPLAISISAFDAHLTDQSDVKLTWTANEEEIFPGYDVQRSRNAVGADWETIAFVPASATGGVQSYELMDNNPYGGRSFYRLRMKAANGQLKMSSIKTITIAELPGRINLFPNPATDHASLVIQANAAGETAHIIITDISGKQLWYQKAMLATGSNTMNLPVQSSWPSGTYIIQVRTDQWLDSKSLVLRRE